MGSGGLFSRLCYTDTIFPKRSLYHGNDVAEWGRVGWDALIAYARCDWIGIFNKGIKNAGCNAGHKGSFQIKQHLIFNSEFGFKENSPFLVVEAFGIF